VRLLWVLSLGSPLKCWLIFFWSWQPHLSFTMTVTFLLTPRTENILKQRAHSCFYSGPKANGRRCPDTNEELKGAGTSMLVWCFVESLFPWQSHSTTLFCLLYNLPQWGSGVPHSDNVLLCLFSRTFPQIIIFDYCRSSVSLSLSCKPHLVMVIVEYAGFFLYVANMCQDYLFFLLLDCSKWP
jgi:hypothetical protein